MCEKTFLKNINTDRFNLMFWNYFTFSTQMGIVNVKTNFNKTDLKK